MSASTGGTVLVVSGAEDATTAVVVAELHRRGAPVQLLDLAEFPAAAFTARFDRGRWDTVVSGRHPSRAGPGSGSTRSPRSTTGGRPGSARRRGCRRAIASTPTRRCASGSAGSWAAIPARWVSHPHAVARAEWKPLQLRTAAEVGLTVPATVISNDPDVAREFTATAPGPVVVKPLSSTVLNDDGTLRIAFTNVIRPEHLADPPFDESFSATVHLLQHWVPKQREARVIVCGSRVLAATIDAHSEAARVDWRRDYASLTYQRVDVPDDVGARLLAYLESCDIPYGAFDSSDVPGTSCGCDPVRTIRCVTPRPDRTSGPTTSEPRSATSRYTPTSWTGRVCAHSSGSTCPRSRCS